MRAPVQVPDILDEQEFTGTKCAPFLHGLDIDLFWPFRFSERGESWVH